MISQQQVAALHIHLSKHGGFTVHPDTLEHADLQGGFIVGNMGQPEVIPVNSDHLKLADLIIRAQLIISNAPDGIDKTNWYIGAWVDDGSIYIEPSEHIRGLEKAVITGRHRSQIAIYKVDTEECINL